MMNLIHNTREKIQKGFTLIETLVAISLLTIAIVAPMTLTMQSLTSAYYARDQITAFFLAQEAIEGVRAVRDANALLTALGTPTDLMTNIPSTIGAPFTVDMSLFTASGIPTLTACSGACSPLQTDGEFYGYRAGWDDTAFTRTVTANYVNGNNDELRVEATVSWTTGAYQRRTFTLSENLYRWLTDVSGGGGSGASLNPNPLSIAAGSGGTITVGVVNSSVPDRNDFVSLEPQGSVNCIGYTEYQYLNGDTNPPDSALPSATLSFSVPPAPGTYEFVLHPQNDCGIKEVVSNPIDVF